MTMTSRSAGLENVTRDCTKLDDLNFGATELAMDGAG